eukprot:7391765-Prymnesium_polylepis.2
MKCKDTQAHAMGMDLARGRCVWRGWASRARLRSLRVDGACGQRVNTGRTPTGVHHEASV